MVREHDNETELYCPKEPPLNKALYRRDVVSDKRSPEFAESRGLFLRAKPSEVGLKQTTMLTGPVGAGQSCVYTYEVIGNPPTRVNQRYGETIGSSENYVLVQGKNEASFDSKPRLPASGIDTAGPLSNCDSLTNLGTAATTSLIFACVLCGFAIILIVVSVIMAVRSR